MITPRRGRRRLPPVQTGLSGRCPECGEGRLFKALLSFQDSCAACSADFRDEDAGDGPAIFVIFIVGIFIVPMALAFHMLLDPPMVVTMLLWGTIIILASLWLLRLMRGVMFNIAWQRKAREVRLEDFKQ
ncbi:DUF983 domain-containing protein [Litorimonas sp. WD9-15]|uniref:DUF983 domain-containing protein n=1 Tax=Litorimonas sp. WD9-15 TaxID=3418716 RepID=UPI003CFED7F6